MIKVEHLTKKYGEVLALEICRLRSKKARSMVFSDQTAPENRRR